MKKVIILVLLAWGMAGYVQAKTPAARITSKNVTIAAGETTNTVKTAWLNTGNDSLVIQADGVRAYTGAGAIRSLMYSASGSISNATLTVYTYDAGVKSSLHVFTVKAAGVATATSASGRFDMTNTVYSGRLWVDISNSRTNSLDTWVWSAIVE
jgi:hypothetical protein